MSKDSVQRSGRVLVTGADGFIGQGLIRALIERALSGRPRGPATLPPGVESAVIGDLRRPINLAEALHGADAIIHAAGIGHASSGIPDETYREVNAGATQALAKAAGQAGVRRFLLLSSVRAQSGPRRR
jgi:UDP-glucose 4-epimerase